MEVIKWDERLTLRINDIDEKQKKIFSYLNTLITLKYDASDARNLIDALIELTEFVRFYFKEEERVLAELKYPDVQYHKKYHKEFLRQIVKARRNIGEDPENLSFETINSFNEWLITHILAEDHQFAPFIRLKMYLKNHNKK